MRIEPRQVRPPFGASVCTREPPCKYIMYNIYELCFIPFLKPTPPYAYCIMQLTNMYVCMYAPKLLHYTYNQCICVCLS